MMMILFSFVHVLFFFLFLLSLSLDARRNLYESASSSSSSHHHHQNHLRVPLFDVVVDAKGDAKRDDDDDDVKTNVSPSFFTLSLLFRVFDTLNMSLLHFFLSLVEKIRAKIHANNTFGRWKKKKKTNGFKMTTLRRRRGGDLRPTTGDGRNPPCVVDVAIASAVFQANPLSSSATSSSATVRTCGDVGQHDTGNTFGVSWREIGDRAKPRTGKDAACAICREEFKTNATSRGQVLTSCAHCFHDACLKSFEQFLASISEERRCPCCRRGYRKVRIDEAKKEVVTEAAVTIQSAFRGFLVRNTLGPTNETARKSWMAGKLRALRKRVERSAEKRRGNTWWTKISRRLRLQTRNAMQTSTGTQPSPSHFPTKTKTVRFAPDASRPLPSFPPRPREAARRRKWLSSVVPTVSIKTA